MCRREAAAAPFPNKFGSATAGRRKIALVRFMEPPHRKLPFSSVTDLPPCTHKKTVAVLTATTMCTLYYCARRAGILFPNAEKESKTRYYFDKLITSYLYCMLPQQHCLQQPQSYRSAERTHLQLWFLPVNTPDQLNPRDAHHFQESS